MANNFISLEEQIKKVLSEYSLIPHTRSSRLFSTVRRMKAEKELGVPLERRVCFAISVKTRKSVNEMTEQEWEDFYKDLSEELKNDYPDIYAKLFAPGEKFCQWCGRKAKDHCSGWWMACGAIYYYPKAKLKDMKNAKE